MNDLLQQLAREVVALGQDDKERAEILGVSTRTITDYKAGKFPRVVMALLEKRIIVLRNRVDCTTTETS